MHRWGPETDRLAEGILDYAHRRLRSERVPLGGPRSAAELDALAGETITEEGVGSAATLRLFDEVLSKACVSVDHPRYLSFIPGAPTVAATLFDLAVSATSIYGGSWHEGAGAIYAENQALRWLADLAGFPDGAGGVFVQGGTLGNLSALVTGRHVVRERSGSSRSGRRVAVTAETHSSVAAAAAVMDAELVSVPTDERGRLTGPALESTLAGAGMDGLFAVVATAGTTNLGIVDDLASVAAVCEERGLWLHVDGAYGAAALAVPSARPIFAGIERADSFIVDPHKWLFAPFDSCALVYRDPSLARAAHTQKAGYLEPLQALGQWDPSDYAFNLSRRARGLPFWFSLAAHGTRAYAEAIERTLAVARAAADDIRSRPYTELVREPDLSVVAFRRLGWAAADYDAWSRGLLEEQIAFVLPTVYRGETITRFAIVNPRTIPDDISTILDRMA